ncbi:MAG: hypothetical protein RIR20_328 [Pseudomonadota bacterium]|jgi:DNA-binding response OmpR family regulator
MMTPSAFQIAIVEDDNILREELAHFMSRQGFKVFEANTANTLNDLLLTNKIDLLILDINLPGQSGLEITKNIRAVFPKIGIVMLTARTSLQDKLAGYEIGADFYLPKPTPVEELLAAVMTLKRRISGEDSSNWKLDTSKRLLIVNQDISITLTATESVLLFAFANAPNRILDIGVICDVLSEKSPESEVSKRSIENLISRLRKKITEAVTSAEQDKIIQSVWNQGYQLCLPISVL